jgi:hypothetical protein
VTLSAAAAQASAGPEPWWWLSAVVSGLASVIAVGIATVSVVRDNRNRRRNHDIEECRARIAEASDAIRWSFIVGASLPGQTGVDDATWGEFLNAVYLVLPDQPSLSSQGVPAIRSELEKVRVELRSELGALLAE